MEQASYTNFSIKFFTNIDPLVLASIVDNI
jgi:hypothetical protein